MNGGMNQGRAADSRGGFTRLPRRCVFCNHCVRVVLTGLEPEQSVCGTAPSFPIVLVVTFGEMLLETGGEICLAREGQMLLLNPGVNFRLSASASADFLALGPSSPAPHVLN